MLPSHWGIWTICSKDNKYFYEIILEIFYFKSGTGLSLADAPFLFFSSSYWDKHLIINEVLLLPGEESRLSLRLVLASMAWVSCDSSLSIVLMFYLLEHNARISVWGVSEVARANPRLYTLALLPLDPPRAAWACILVFLRGLAPNLLEMVIQVLCKDFLAWVMLSHYVKYFTLYYLSSS